jgi:hypothetical protein
LLPAVDFLVPVIIFAAALALASVSETVVHDPRDQSLVLEFEQPSAPPFSSSCGGLPEQFRDLTILCRCR